LLLLNATCMRSHNALDEDVGKEDFVAQKG